MCPHFGDIDKWNKIIVNWCVIWTPFLCLSARSFFVTIRNLPPRHDGLFRFDFRYIARHIKSKYRQRPSNQHTIQEKASAIDRKTKLGDNADGMFLFIQLFYQIQSRNVFISRRKNQPLNYIHCLLYGHRRLGGRSTETVDDGDSAVFTYLSKPLFAFTDQQLPNNTPCFNRTNSVQEIAIVNTHLLGISTWILHENIRYY